MVDRDYVREQLKKINFGTGRFNRAEMYELEHILLPEEQIYECVNGYYEGGVALLVATDTRVLLIDKKPMGFLNVDDLRFDMISDIDYSHRLFGAQIKINCGMKDLLFKSYNQPRLRKLIGHVQQRMSEIKREMSDHANGQKQHLEDINKQLQMYLLAQQQQLERQIAINQQIDPVKPSPKLADYLFAQRLLEDFHARGSTPTQEQEPLPQPEKPIAGRDSVHAVVDQKLLDEIAEDGRREVFGAAYTIPNTQSVSASVSMTSELTQGLDVSPHKIACAKLPYLLRTRRYSRAKTSSQNIF